MSTFSDQLVSALSSPAYPEGEVRSILDAAAGGSHDAVQHMRRLGAAARARRERPHVDLALMAIAELPWGLMKLESGPAMPPLVHLFGWPSEEPGENGLLQMAAKDLKDLVRLSGRCDADVVRDVVLAVESGEAEAMRRVGALLAPVDRRDRAQTSIASAGERAARVSDLLRAGLDGLEDELAFITTVGAFAPSVHAHRLAEQKGLSLSAPRAYSNTGAYAHVDEHRPVLELVHHLSPDTLWERLATYVGSPWWNNNWRVNWLVGALPWDEALHIVGDDDVWHGRRSGKAVLVCGGARSKKGTVNFKVHKTVAAAEKDLRTKAAAAGDKLGTPAQAKPARPAKAGELLLKGAEYGDRYLVDSVLATGVPPDEATTEYGETALLALEGRDPEIARMLLAAGADPRRTPSKGTKNALDACCMGSGLDARETARVIAATGVGFGAPKESFSSAIYRNQIGLVEMLLAAGHTMPAGLQKESAEPGTRAFVFAHGG
jgi:hypothetical protein